LPSVSEGKPFLCGMPSRLFESSWQPWSPEDDGIVFEPDKHDPSTELPGQLGGFSGISFEPTIRECSSASTPHILGASESESSREERPVRAGRRSSSYRTDTIVESFPVPIEFHFQFRLFGD